MLIKRNKWTKLRKKTELSRNTPGMGNEKIDEGREMEEKKDEDS